MRLGALILLLAGCAETGSVAGWERVTDLEPSPVPSTPSPVNELVALGGGGWSFNGRQVAEAELLRLVEGGAALTPMPVVLADFSAVGLPSEKRRLMIAVGRAAGCVGDYPVCFEGTRAEYDRL
jgi:hypothetical protein